MEYELSNGSVKVRVASKGAELLSVESGGAEYLWNGDPAFWAERSPLLFPYVGRFTAVKYRYHGREYEMNIHGFARKMEFQEVRREKESLELCLTDTQETYVHYPFHFSLHVDYRLEGNAVRVGYRVKNCSGKTMYFGIGGHPGFRVPLEEGSAFSDYYLEFGDECRPERVGHTRECFLSGADREYPLEGGRRIRLSHDLFDEDAVVLRDMADSVTLRSEKGGRAVTVSYPGMSYLGIWHAPRREAPYVCIEPWTSLPSRQGVVEDIRFKSDLVKLPDGETYENGWEIGIE